MEAIVYLSIGSNLGDRLVNINKAIDELKSIGTVNKVSSFYENPPIEFDASELFVNCCVEIATKLSPSDLLAETQSIERSIGREKKTTEAYESRIIDIDIIYYDSEILELPTLQIPHPKRADRMFVLIPLNDIAGTFIDPILKRPVKQLLNQFDTKELQVMIRIENM